MGYSSRLGLVILILTLLFCNVASITNRRDVEDHVRISRAQGGEPLITDWEIGLREATHQALMRDGYTDPSLHGYLQNAPFSGKQAVKAFGDIAILARGQLYATPVGFNFVQDPYHNDCDECHNEKRKCVGNQCGDYKPRQPEQLVALWTVKRIRHRDENYGHRYEIEYTISPIDKAVGSGFITRNGRFDYGIPGHVFVIRSNPRYTNGYQHNQFFSSPDQVKWHRNYISRPTGEHYPNVIITHAQPPPIPNIYHAPDGGVQYEASTTDPREIQLYRNLINSLASKTSTTGHRFKVEGQSTSPQTSIDRITTPLAPTKTTYQLTPPDLPQRTTLVQLPTGQIVPLTEIATSTVPEGQLQILTPVHLDPIHPIPIPIHGFHLVPTQPISVTERHYPHTESTVSNQIPSTTIPIFIMKELATPSATPQVVKDMGSTKLPKKTTIHFFAAEDKSSPEDKTTDDIFQPTKKFTTRKKFTKTTSGKTTKNDYDDDNFDLFPVMIPTEAMRKVTKAPFRVTSQSVNQVPRPYKDSATTLPYSSSTTTSTQETQPTFGSRTTISVSATSPTLVPTTYGTQSTRITLPLPSTTEQQISTRNTIFRTPTVFRKFTTTQFQEGTMVPSTTPSTTNYDTVSTAEPRETIVTVTPVQTISMGYSNYDEGTVSTIGYTPSRFSTLGHTDQTTLQRESQLDSSLSRTTFVYPNTGILSTTFSPRTLSTNLEENPSTKRISTTQAYNTNTESLPTTSRQSSTLSVDTSVTDYNRLSTQPYNMAFPSTETVPVEATLSPTAKLTTTHFESTNPTRVATTELKPNKNIKNDNDFLVEDISSEDASEPISKNRSKFQEYTDDDIFGPVTKPKDKKTSKYKQQKSKIYKTDFTTEPTRTVAKTPKIIYSDFYEASTIPATSSLTQFYAESQNNIITKPLDATTERLPLTSQSYLTSISYKVNKKNSATPSMDEIEVLPTIKAKLSNVVNSEKLQVFKAELPENEENSTNKVSDKDAFDNIALQLVNHARSLDLLNQKPKEEKKNASQEKKTPKYKRRNLYAPKYRRNQSGKEKNLSVSQT